MKERISVRYEDLPEPDGEWPLGVWIEIQPGLYAREVPGRKGTDRIGKTDRRVEMDTNGPVTPGIRAQIIFFHRYSLNEERLKNSSRPWYVNGGRYIWQMLADVPVMGPFAASEKWIPRQQKPVWHD